MSKKWRDFSIAFFGTMLVLFLIDLITVFVRKLS